ncbi:hypothetical protein K466DRAFT_550215 [Polyporus arcularius HHB13444]|uniref:Fungal-type protein kinase domain-containing protein n=1 Tax=Polyporus arcularius HHB13444 TaxID=1314778 RepID=A0A5C3PKQ9_9APHY|nr:hypothetical protein K466DRAFT_550215 [Polyporus arcularius HHB13444]
MVRKVDGAYRRVPNDWDLATMGADEHHRLCHDNSHPVGNWIFMALDLMTDEGHNVPRLYRHDLEGYTWILPWVFLQASIRRAEHGA